MVKRLELVNYAQQLMQVERFKDYCPNGLQVEGRDEIKKIVTGVSASLALLEAAQEANADLILVHHGYFWRNEDVRLVGMKYKRIRFLVKHELNLMAYHLPLDAHAELGNNIQLASLLGIMPIDYNGATNLLARGYLPQPKKLSDFVADITHALQRAPLVVGDLNKPIRNVAWCTGAAQSYMEAAIEAGVDVFISGEISEQTVHQAQESGVAYIAAGHHATERYGVQALGAHLADRFQLSHEFIDIQNPV